MAACQMDAADLAALFGHTHLATFLRALQRSAPTPTPATATRGGRGRGGVEPRYSHPVWCLPWPPLLAAYCVVPAVLPLWPWRTVERVVLSSCGIDSLSLVHLAGALTSQVMRGGGGSLHGWTSGHYLWMSQGGVSLITWARGV